MTHLSSLIERIEKSEGADREIDALIYHDLLGFCRHARKVKTGAQSDTGFDCLDCGADSWGNKSYKGGFPTGQGLHDSAPRYTASIDAAMTLIPEGSHCGMGYDSPHEGETVGRAWAWVRCKVNGKWEETPTDWRGHRPPSIALALCAAALRAQIKEME